MMTGGDRGVRFALLGTVEIHRESIRGFSLGDLGKGFFVHFSKGIKKFFKKKAERFNGNSVRKF